MAGGLMQLVAVGPQDYYINANPNVTFFKVIYRRHTNFAVESIEQYFNGNTDFGKKCSCEIARNGDLITKVTLKATLPEVVYTGNFRQFSHVEFAWVKRVGHALIDETELEIGGSRIDKQYGDWLNIWYDVSHPVGQEEGYAKMIGDVPLLTDISTLSLQTANANNNILKPAYDLYVPLQFYFCRYNGLALPLIALQYHQVRIYVKFRRAEELYIANQAFRQNGCDNFQLNDALLYVDYVYLDSQERRRFAQVSHEYLIEQLQFTSEESIGNSNSGKFRINFNHPVKALYWVVKLGNYQGGRFMIYTPCDWEEAIENAAKLLILSEYDLDNYGYFNAPVLSTGNDTYIGDNGVEYIGINPASPLEESKYTFDDSRTANKFDGSVLIGILSPSTPLLKRNKQEDLRFKVAGVVKISTDYESDGYMYPTVETVTKNELTICDLSIPIDRFDFDNRNCYIQGLDVFVYDQFNYGVYIDGSVNPVTEVEFQLNGQDRLSKRSGFWYNYVVPYYHFPNSPPPGLNIYSFALNPVEHQPSGTANFSRIDTAYLILKFFQNVCDQDIFISSDNKVYIYGINYNVLRIMSGMAGVAYSN